MTRRDKTIIASMFGTTVLLLAMAGIAPRIVFWLLALYAEKAEA